MIRPAKEMDIQKILHLTQACGAALRVKNIFQWNSHYPNSTVLTMDINRNELWVFEDDSELIGCMVLTDLMDEEYASIPWSLPDESAKYVHRLGVHPKWQRNGIASRLMDFAEQQSRLQGATAIRLDTFSRNPGNQLFYEKRGYLSQGAIYFPHQSAYPFYCYELSLKST